MILAASSNHLAEYPEPQREIAAQALTAMGVTPIESIERVAGGVTTALTLRVQAGGQAFLLRVEGEPSPLRNPHQYESMRIGADAGIAPKIHYLDESARVVVMDFVEAHPLQDYPGGRPALAQALAGLLKRLQAAPVFPDFVEYPDIVSRLFAYVRRTGLFASGVLDRHVEHLERITERYKSGQGRLVSSHNDLHPGNLIFDGRRLWLIDWESAYRNDPLVDVSIAIDSFAFSPELQDTLLEMWLGRVPDRALRSRMETVRALTRLYFAGVFLSASATAQGAVNDTDLSAPTVAEFTHSLREGTLKPGTPVTRHIMGKMYLAAFLSGDPAPGFGAVVQ
jgi:aminoglycoside phosphotransferase (APT) family kinase protein